MKTPIDPKRTIKAISKVVNFDNDVPGASENRYSDTTLVFACPGCGKVGAIDCKVGEKEPHSWKIEEGSLLDVTTLTLSPSIHCIDCCGWHGWLKKGIYESC